MGVFLEIYDLSITELDLYTNTSRDFCKEFINRTF